MEEFELRAPQEGEVLVETSASLISLGTEGICYNRLFAPGTHFDNWVKYPFYPGYSTVGVVREMGPGVEAVRIGQTIAVPCAHASHAVVSASELAVVEPEVPLESAVWFTLSMITYNGVRNCRVRLGDRVAVIGAGPIGQMTMRWALASGAEHAIMIDPAQKRCDIARQGGATAALACDADSARDEVSKILGGLPDVVVDATGHPAAFQPALRLVKNQGKVLLIGDAGDPSQQRLIPDVVTRGIQLIGAHYMSEFPERSRTGTYSLFFRLVSDGRFSMKGLNAEWFDARQPDLAYRLSTERRDEVMGLLFRW